MLQSVGELVFEKTESKDVERRVVLIQLTLKDRSHYTHKVDGLFGPNTEKAVTKFQARKKLPETGKIDRATGEALGLPFWTKDVTRTLDPPFRDDGIFPTGEKFVFQSNVDMGFFSSWPDAAYDSSNILTRRALRTNNPGALNISSWQKKLPGYVGMTHPDNSPNKNQTTVYSAPEYGVAAWGVLLKDRYFKGKKDPVSLGTIIDKYRGGISREPYLAGYKKYSNGKLTEDYLVDLYNAAELAILALASFSHEFGNWYPLTDDQISSGFALADRMIAAGVLPSTSSEVDALQIDAEDEDQYAEGIDTFGSLTSMGAPRLPNAERIGIEDAKWPNDPANAPDTWHLPTPLVETEFELTAEIIKGLIEVGYYKPDVSTNGKLIIALRGCVIVDGSAYVEDAATIRVKPVKPDHENFLCLIGSVDTTSDQLSVYTASTVPRRTGMLRFYNKINFGSAGMNCNMLPAGVYEHCVGTHGGHAGPVEYVLRLGDGPTSADAGPATVLRTTNDLIYGTMDTWDNTKPGDNIHPAFLNVSFSSVGCLTVRGKQTPGESYKTASGEWRRFRANVGFDGHYYGNRFDSLVATGYEAAAIAAALAAKSSLDPLVCLRQGSQGNLVKQLQEQLGIDPPDGQFGAHTCEALVTKQRSVLGYATGTWSPAMATLLGLKFG